jgi:hypothetical protein
MMFHGNVASNFLWSYGTDTVRIGLPVGGVIMLSPTFQVSLSLRANFGP